MRGEVTDFGYIGRKAVPNSGTSYLRCAGSRVEKVNRELTGVNVSNQMSTIGACPIAVRMSGLRPMC